MKLERVEAGSDLLLELVAHKKGFPGGSVVKNPPVNARDTRDKGLIPWVGKSPWRRKWQPTPALLPGESHGLRSLAGYSPQGRKRSDTTEVT